MNTPTLCFVHLYESYRRLKFCSGLKEVNGESRGHPISPAKYILYFYCSEIQLFIIFAAVKYSFFTIGIIFYLCNFLYIITLFLIKYDKTDMVKLRVKPLPYRDAFNAFANSADTDSAVLVRSD